MQNVKIEIKVSLASGATVGLTENQHNQIVGFVSNLLFIEVEKRTYSKRKVGGHNRKWSAEEDELLLPLLSMEDGLEKRKYYKKIQKQIKRGMGSLYSRLHNLKLRQNDTTQLPPNFGTITVTDMF